MNELSTNTTQLPDTIEDLSKFVIVGKEKLKAVKAAISAIEKVNLAKEVHQQKLAEAQELAEVVIEAEARLGELLKAIPKQAGKSNFSRDVEKLKSKSETIKDMGFNKDQVSDFQRMADKPEIIERAKAKAKEENRVLSHSDVMKEIKFEKELEYLEANADEATKERIRNGEQSINDAWLEEKRREDKRNRQKAENALEAAQDRHDEYKGKKVVSLEDAKQDKEDQAKIADALFWEVDRALSSLSLLGAMAEAGDKDLRPLGKISDEKKELLKNSVRGARNAIIRIQEVII